MNFLDACYQIQQSYSTIFTDAVVNLGFDDIFATNNNNPPILFKVVKYLPAYVATKPHYDGTLFSLFLDSTDNQALLLCPYKPLFNVDDFYAPARQENRAQSVLLIPGALLQEFGIDPTPHIVMHSGSVRYATIAFAMRPHFMLTTHQLSLLPSFKD